MSKKEVKTPNKKDQQDDSTPRLVFGYRKRCDVYGIIPHPEIKGKLDEMVEKGKFQILHCVEEIGPMQVRALMEIATELRYLHLRKVSIWKGGITDEGLRFICKYLSVANTLELIDLMDNGLTPLGCQFLGKSLISPFVPLRQLKLDNNLILAEGLKHLALGLRQNNTLDKLSLKYCGIQGEGAKYIQQILANIDSKLRSLKLQGNPIGNEGIYQILRAVQCSESLQKVNIADTKMLLLEYQEGKGTIIEAIADQLEHIMAKNMLIIKYDIRFNPMHTSIATRLLKSISINPRIRKMEFANNVAYEIRDQLDTVLRKRNKPIKGKKKSKK